MLKRIHGVGRDPNSSATSGNSWPRGCRGPPPGPVADGPRGAWPRKEEAQAGPGPGLAGKHLLWAFLPPRPRSPRWLVGSGQVSPKQEEARCRPAVERLTPEAFLTSALPQAPHRVPGGALAADRTWSGSSAGHASCQGRCPVVVAHAWPPATTHPSAEEAEAQGIGSGRGARLWQWQTAGDSRAGTSSGPGVWAQTAALPLTHWPVPREMGQVLCHHGRVDAGPPRARVLMAAAGPPEARSRQGGAHTHGAGAVGQSPGWAAGYLQLGMASGQQPRAVQVRSPGERPRPDQAAHGDAHEGCVEGRALRPSLEGGEGVASRGTKEGRPPDGWPGCGLEGAGNRGEGPAPCHPLAQGLVLLSMPWEPLGVSVLPLSLAPSDDGAQGQPR